MRTLADRLTELRGLLKRHRIGLTFTDRGLPPRAWRGFITQNPTTGWVIWVNSSLDRFTTAWVVAHELGHYCARQQLGLLPLDDLWLPSSDFDLSTQRNWSRSRRADSNELAASRWAANLLVFEEEWREAERCHPCCLHKMAAVLDAPIEAVYFCSQGIREGLRANAIGRATVSTEAVAKLRKPKPEKRGGVEI